ncbi:hypothetical protein T10_1947 [Trichinella papuae]|uniref:Integrase catalytic domain-containing protein n=1 Tax=Trichinella papuae TaxID=268474 RepID=A0A0V1MNF8_9BILA|nr:hypothetical protein T10_1947 [Trichinella papuae]
MFLHSLTDDGSVTIYLNGTLLILLFTTHILNVRRSGRIRCEWNGLKQTNSLPETDAIPADGILSHLLEHFPFENTGIDFTGPVYLWSERKFTKSHIYLFTCMTTRAVHLQQVPDMTLEKSLLSVRRLFARRRYPKRIYSDNFQTFEHVDREQ